MKKSPHDQSTTCTDRTLFIYSGTYGGVTAEIQLGSLRAFGDIRYLFGLSDVDGTDSRTVNNKGLAFSAGFIFKLFGQQY